MEYSFVTTQGPAIGPNNLPKKIGSPAPVRALPKENEPTEKRRLIQALKQTNGNQSKAAKLLNINRVTVWNRMKKYRIDLKKVLSV
jgi:transcriptional regulator of acetoin/glycerol metabolism